MVFGILLTVLGSVLAGIATNIITDKWKVSGGGRAVAIIVVMLLIVAVGLTFAEDSIFGVKPSEPFDPTTTKPQPGGTTATTEPPGPSR